MMGERIFLLKVPVLKCVLIHRESVEGLILSSQISSKSGTRVDLGNDTVLLTFNVGQVRINSILCITVYRLYCN